MWLVGLSKEGSCGLFGFGRLGCWIPRMWLFEMFGRAFGDLDDRRDGCLVCMG